jgi:hypothetical protein
MINGVAGQGRLLGTSVFLFLLALTIVKGIRMPNRWSVTHYLFNYDDGFVKRGLWGELLRHVLGSWTAKYFCLAALALLVFGALVLLLVVASRRVEKDEPDRVAFLLVMFASPALTFAAHMVGYLEQLAYAVLLLILLQRRHWRLQVAAAAAAAAFLPLVHEASALWVGGLLGLVLIAGPLGRRRPPRERFAALALMGTLLVASTLAALFTGRISVERAAAMRDDRTAFFDVRPRQDAFATLSVPLEASLADMRVRWTDPDTRLDMFYSLCVFGPAALFLGVLAFRKVRSDEGSPSVRLATLALTALAIGGPLLLHIAAWDRHRWNGLATLNAGLAALTLMASGQAPAAGGSSPVRRPVASMSAALAVCLWSVTADPIFFDNYGPAHPPFVYQLQFLREAVETRDPNIWIPEPGN